MSLPGTSWDHFTKVISRHVPTKWPLIFKIPRKKLIESSANWAQFAASRIGDIRYHLPNPYIISPILPYICSLFSSIDLFRFYIDMCLHLFAFYALIEKNPKGTLLHRRHQASAEHFQLAGREAMGSWPRGAESMDHGTREMVRFVPPNSFNHFNLIY